MTQQCLVLFLIMPMLDHQSQPMIQCDENAIDGCDSMVPALRGFSEEMKVAQQETVIHSIVQVVGSGELKLVVELPGLLQRFVECGSISGSSEIGRRRFELQMTSC